MSTYALNLEKYASLARQAAAEGCVLLKNDKQALPLTGPNHVAVFGRSAFNYYKSGLGSGGLVNTRYVVSILDALKECPDLILNNELQKIYTDWISENPYDEGQGWGQVPWSQKEMPVTDEMLRIASSSDASLVIVGRTAGEDQDAKNEAGSYLLTAEEEDMIAKVCASCPRTIVILNVGNIIDMNWVDKYNPQAVLYAWQGGQEGGHGVADVLTGKISPCGKLTDTIAYEISDYPSTANFGDKYKNFYKEDIYVGYRYFETFARDRVLYPFGYGLSYTTFDIRCRISANTADAVTITAKAANTGGYPGKEVVQVYVKAPQGKLGQPARRLIGYAKTQVLCPGACETLTISIPKYYLSSYDDSGITGHKSCYVLEEGRYEIYAGSDVRSALPVGSYQEEFTVVQQLTESYAPTEAFRRMKAVLTPDGNYRICEEDVPLRTTDPRQRLLADRPALIPYTADRGYQLADVLDNKVSLDDFIAQIDDDSLIHMFRGEGMCSPKVTPGTAAAFGGVTDKLQAFGIPAACCSDGPSGIRMDCGTKAFSLPNGTELGCTFNDALVKELYAMLGWELRLNKIDSLLGPGMNIHRNPLNGRNFEYISEDPLLTGRISAAQIAGMAIHGIGGTIKHFCANNQEYGRRFSDSVISERALREIYLKGFEIAVKEGGARSVMTTYGSVNGLWTAGSYDLCTTILRKEWGFDGIVMTDWWAEANYEGRPSAKTCKAPMIAAQNDLYMVTADSASNPENDDVPAQLEAGYITRAELHRNARNILSFILKSPSILHKTGRIAPEELAEMNKKGDNDISPADMAYYFADKETHIVTIDGSALNPKARSADVFGVHVEKNGFYSISFALRSDLGPLAQLPISVYYDNALKTMISIQGTEGKEKTVTADLGFFFGNNHFIKLYYGANGLVIDKVQIKFEKD